MSSQDSVPATTPGATEPTSPLLPQTEVMPAGIHHAYAFQVFNTLSFSVVLGAPMILYFQYLQASATILGIVAALPPLLIILQVPAARFVETVGYRKFVTRGWAARAYLTAGFAFVAMLPDAWVDRATRIALMLLLLFGYNTLRAISSCGFLPWLTALVPQGVRGHYVSRDQMAVAISTVVCLGLNAAILAGDEPTPMAFCLIFFFSTVTGVISVFFLRRIPDVPVTASSPSSQAVPYKEMLFYPPFLKIIFFNLVVCMAQAPASVFWFQFFREHFHMSATVTLLVCATGPLVSLMTLWAFGSIIDRVGSRPILVLAIGLMTLHYLGWAGMAADTYPFNWFTVGLQQLTAGVGWSLYSLANVRLLMGTVPEMGRSHFFALHGVLTNLTLGIVPIIWGIILDALKGWHMYWHGWHGNRWSALFLVLTATFLAAQFFLRRLSEPRAMTTEAFMRELLIHSPSRILARVLTRRGLP